MSYIILGYWEGGRPQICYVISYNQFKLLSKHEPKLLFINKIWKRVIHSCWWRYCNLLAMQDMDDDVSCYVLPDDVILVISCHILSPCVTFCHILWYVMLEVSWFVTNCYDNANNWPSQKIQTILPKLEDIISKFTSVVQSWKRGFVSMYILEVAKKLCKKLWSSLSHYWCWKRDTLLCDSWKFKLSCS